MKLKDIRNSDDVKAIVFTKHWGEYNSYELVFMKGDILVCSIRVQDDIGESKKKVLDSLYTNEYYRNQGYAGVMMEYVDEFIADMFPGVEELYVHSIGHEFFIKYGYEFVGYTAKKPGSWFVKKINK